MSSDEFDPMIEKLFARQAPMADADLFAADVQKRLARGSAVRAAVLGGAGLIGGLLALRETAGHLSVSTASGLVGEAAATRGLAQAGASLQSSLDQYGLSQLSLGSMGGMQLFWITAGAIVALLAAGVVKLSQEA